MLDLSDIRNQFQTAFTTPALISKKRTPAVLGKYSIRQSIYSWMALHELIAILKKITLSPFDSEDDFESEDDRLNKYSIRFVIDSEMQIWFAREGTYSGSIPAHSHMVDDESVFAAGNLLLSEDYRSIVGITNKSGHYEPGLGTLVYVIAVLFSLENHPKFPLKFAPNITLTEYRVATAFHPKPTANLEISKANLQHLLPENSEPTLREDSPYKKLRTANTMIIIESDSSLSSPSSRSSSSDRNSSLGSLDSFADRFFGSAGSRSPSPDSGKKRPAEQEGNIGSLHTGKKYANSVINLSNSRDALLASPSRAVVESSDPNSVQKVLIF